MNIHFCYTELSDWMGGVPNEQMADWLRCGYIGIGRRLHGLVCHAVWYGEFIRWETTSLIFQIRAHILRS